MKGILRTGVLAGALAVALAVPVQAQEALYLARDCLTALKKAAGEKFDSQSSATCDRAVAASSDNPALLRMLGAVYFKFGKPDRARTILEAAIALGDIEAMTGLGLMYFEGRGVQQDYARAAELLLTPAEAGDPHAQNALGQLFERGLGLPQSNELALKWYRLSAEQGHPKAIKAVRRLEENL